MQKKFFFGSCFFYGKKKKHKKCFFQIASLVVKQVFRCSQLKKHTSSRDVNYCSPVTNAYFLFECINFFLTLDTIDILCLIYLNFYAYKKYMGA